MKKYSGPAEQRRRKKQQMQAGPRIAKDGFTIIVPSLWFDVAAAQCWVLRGFSFRTGECRWERDARKPIEGKAYPPAVWLNSTREEFFSFWPQLAADKECPSCGETFAPEDNRQIHCADCIDIVQE